MNEIFNNFTELQILQISELLNWINDCNTNVQSNCKVGEVEMYKDSRNQFFISYYLRMSSGEGVKSSCEYFRIDRAGNKLNLKDVYETESDIVSKFSTLEKLKP